MPIPLPPIVLEAYAQRKASLPVEVIGLLLIGSRALGQSVAASDFDTRLIALSDAPFVRYDEPVWTPASNMPTVVLGWADLNPTPAAGVSFGLTNLSYVERCVQSGYFPLNDHTAMFQGVIAIDESGALAAFREKYRGAVFANVAPDYQAQTGWRVSQRLSRERAAMWRGEGLDGGKRAVPALHTCCRIVQEIAQIAAYQQRGMYLGQMSLVADYYATRWPDFGPTLEALFRYKIDEAQRRAMFERIQARDQECLSEADALAEHTVKMWQRFTEYAETDASTSGVSQPDPRGLSLVPPRTAIQDP
jgi:hypothetical protein